jgi:hypothetical protein
VFFVANELAVPHFVVWSMVAASPYSMLVFLSGDRGAIEHKLKEP